MLLLVAQDCRLMKLVSWMYKIINKDWWSL